MADSVGRMLRAAREERRLSTTDIAKKTRIPQGSVVALEECDFARLPAPVFVRGFIRSYCREVDVEANEVLAHYDEYLSQTTRMQEESDAPVGYGPLVLNRADGLAPRANRSLQVSHVLLLLIALATFIVAYVTAGSTREGTSARTDTAQTETRPAQHAKTSPR